MMDNISESTCENQGLTLSNSNFDKAKAHEMLIPQVLDPLTPQSSGWDPQNNNKISKQDQRSQKMIPRKTKESKK